MKHYKQIDNGYIVAIGTGGMGVEISEQEYNAIKTAIASKPTRTATMDYRLKEDLTWESFEIEPEPETDEIDGDIALSILLGE